MTTNGNKSEFKGGYVGARPFQALKNKQQNLKINFKNSQVTSQG